MNNSVLWTNPSRSSLGDRLIDVMLLSALAKLVDADLYFDWLDVIFEYGVEKEPKYQHSENEFKSWDNVRFEDYKIENWSKYFNLPKNVKINQKISNPTYIFQDYLGGIFSTYTFYDRYVQNICTFDMFCNSFKETMKEFTPTDKLLNLVSSYPKPNISVHLRRTDKIRVLAAGNEGVCMNLEMLDELNNLTEKAIDKLNIGEKVFFFASDDIKEREKFNNKYPNHIEILEISEIEKTYVDLYLMSISDYIILSQVHSNYSIFASLINEAKLIYLYDNCMIINEKFNLMDNFISLKNLMES